MTIPSGVHDCSQRRLRLNLDTRDIFRIFTVLDRVSKPVWSKSGVKESRESIDNSLPINIFLKIHAIKFGYPGEGSYIYHVEQLSTNVKIKVICQIY